MPGPHTWVPSLSLHFNSGKLLGHWRQPVDREERDPATPLDISKPAASDNGRRKDPAKSPRQRRKPEAAPRYTVLIPANEKDR
ncbi:hypothetical protein K0M31_009504 [Melipona bicolor]|uniref:Uncharacterized protein n=1 Tax=Melipona bicolor TaxID=60889 RepID=A0AA40FN76_9HYME|nr:hypothetical protein K0M31_009504 [Melipona bicolor]